MATNDDIKERWKDVIVWETFWDELDILLNDTFDQGVRSSEKRLKGILQELVDRLDEVQHLESKLFRAREILKDIL